MRIRKLMIPLFAFALVATACGGDDDDDGGATATTEGGGGGALENTGEVQLLSAGEPEETDAYQAIFDDLINAETDYKVEVVPAGDFEQQFQIQAEGGTLDVAAVPQPGAIPDLVDKGLLDLARGPRVQHRRAQRASSASPSWPSASTRASTTASPPTST